MVDRRSGPALLPEPHTRAAALEAMRTSKMARSAHAYVRGSTAQFYEWLERASPAAMPATPSVWICGDCHVGNLGPLADAEGNVSIQVRDLDQTVVGNPAHDLIRLGLSLAAAARSSDLPGIATAHMLEEMIRGYQDALAGHEEGLTEARAGKTVRRVVAEATRRRWEHLARERLDQIEPKIPLGKRFWPLSDEEREAISHLVSSDAALQVIGSFHGRREHADVEVVDAAYWVKGCSSLGTLRYAVLLRMAESSKKPAHCLVDIKEAVASVAPAATEMPVVDDAERIVMGAQALSPALGNRMLAGRLLGRSVVMRELMPQDLKLEIDRLNPDEAVKAAHFLAGVIGHAHARQMTTQTRLSWKAQLNRDHTRNLDAPRWLWKTIVDLIGRHEAAYLEYCRTFASAA